MTTITQKLDEFVKSQYARRWSAVLDADGKTINVRREPDGPICGTVTITDGKVDVRNVMSGNKNLLGALAKREIREFVQANLEEVK